MNRFPTIARIVVSSVGTILANYLLIRGIMRLIHRPRDESRRAPIALVIAVLTAIPAIINNQRLVATSKPAVQAETK